MAYTFARADEVLVWLGFLEEISTVKDSDSTKSHRESFKMARKAIDPTQSLGTNFKIVRKEFEDLCSKAY
jgi:hypothetical protein